MKMKNNNKNRNKNKNQSGGELNCKLDETSSSFLILGHGCDTIDEVYTIPDNWVYVTSGLCGVGTHDSLDFIKLKRDFFNNEPYIKNPCQYYETLNSFFTYNMNIHFANSPSTNNRTFVNSTFILLADFYTNDSDEPVLEKDAEFWSASKSGIYVNTNDNSKYANRDIVVTVMKNSENQFIITDEQIERIYEGSILPTAQQVIQSIQQISGKTGKYTTSDLRYCNYQFRISLSKLLYGFSSKMSSGVIFNPLCRVPCDKNTSATTSNKYELRRVNSLSGMDATQKAYYNQEPQNVEQYLGGKKYKKYKKTNKKKNKNKKQTRRNK